MMKKLTEDNFKQEIASEKKTLVDFYAEWCGPCRMLNPILEELAEEMSANAQFAKIDIDAAENVAGEYQITSVPTLILFQGGEEKGRIVGASDKEAIMQFIEKTGS